LREALAAAEANGLDPGQTRLLIAGHGSKLGPASATATRKAAARVAIARRFAIVATAFLEEEPFVEDALRGNPTPTVIAGFFFGDGLHAGDDIPEIIAEAGAHAVYTGAIGNNPAVAPLIAAALLSQTNKAPSP
jgi:sirohydrochlorin ferrochelatase